MFRRTLLFLVPALASGLLGVGCQTAYYNTLERFGVYKRDVLADRIEKAATSQAEAKEQILTTLAAFQAVTGFEGGDLAEAYERLNDEYERSVRAAREVSSRIESVESVSEALFEEWGEEVKEISDVSLRRRSEDLRRDSLRRYDDLIATMHSAEAKLAPVLTAFNDRVLLLKHNLNAEAIRSLDEDYPEIEARVEDLIADMQKAIDEADAYLKSLETPE
ncbi:MAG: DUF2959 family protein [Planctomycetota bacterium]